RPTAPSSYDDRPKNTAPIRPDLLQDICAGNYERHVSHRMEQHTKREHKQIMNHGMATATRGIPQFGSTFAANWPITSRWFERPDLGDCQEATGSGHAPAGSRSQARYRDLRV